MMRASLWTRVVAETRRIGGVFMRTDEDGQMREEMRFHVDMHAAKLRGAGVSDAEARRQAAIAFGGESQWAEAGRDEYRSRPLEEAAHDARVVARSLRRSPTFTATVLLTLATGIGASAAIFTLVNDVVIRPLPYGRPSELVSVSTDMPALGFRNAGITPGMFYTYQRLARSFDGITVYRKTSTNANDPAGVGEPERFPIGYVSGNFMALFRVPAEVGRVLSDADDQPSAPKVMVISDALWHSRFGGDARVIGKHLIAGGADREIVGVMPSSFRVPEDKTQAWLPLQLDPSASWLGGFNSEAYARLRPGVSVAAATRDLMATLPRAKELFPLIAPGVTATLLFEQAKPVPTVTPLRDTIVGGVASTLWLVAAAAGLVLLVMCANVANLMLVRVEGRRQELAIRVAIGASRWRVISYFLIECLLLAGVAAALGLAAATAGVRLLVSASPIGIPRLTEVRVDWATVLFVGLASIVVAAACAIPSAVRAIRGGLAALRESGRGATAGRSRIGARSALVGFQMALALVALMASALLLRSVARLHAVRPGFDATGVATLWVTAPVVRYPKDTAVDRFHSALLARVRGLPGVTDAGFSTSLPLGSGHNSDPLYVEGSRDLSKTIPPLQFYAAADAGFFRALKIPLVAGRTFGALETQRWNEAVVSRETAKRMFGDSTGTTVVGKRFQILPNGPFYTVIGVIGSVRDTSLTMPPAMSVYVAPVASGDSVEGQNTRTAALVARTTGDVEATTRAMRRIVHDVDPTLPTFDTKPMGDLVSASTARQTFLLVVLTIAAGVTLLLGVVGLYGAIAFVVSLRRRELGLRIALGATPGAVAMMVARRGLTLSIVGIGFGGALAIVATRFLRTFLFEVAPFDPLAFAASAGVLAACAIAASWVPARRAARVDPAMALRAE